MNIRRLVAPALAALATAGVLTATGVAAGDSDESGPPPTQREAQTQVRQDRTDHLAKVAKRLDVSTDRLEAAIKVARHRALDADVEAGRLTGAQRNAILACEEDPLTCDRSNLPAPRVHRLPGSDDNDRPTRAEMEKRMKQFRAEAQKRQSAFYAAVASELGKDASAVRKAFEAERPHGGPREHHIGRGPGGPGAPGHHRGGPAGAGIGPPPGGGDVVMAGPPA